ncbi:hypothetical protein D0809_21810 [Flavobacterium circumlabens]|uniref:Lipoprotein n=1 Tax=Flavobacterium circumlabens TaxID=2133765 RepID=A0A4Y7U8X4_9FLAO|nr:hypothetical protein [Flavobacterium circumlabens]TCN61339.1 hypothetical protein EV142_101928 [Flavobacterium circumlabens]TEB42212.1 hypothetical protein D0809_21810 [Flavobacterium circumlabens]
MNIKNKFLTVIITILFITACSDKQKTATTPQEQTKNTANLPVQKSSESIEGIYSSDECALSVKITKTKDGYAYFLETSARKVKGNATVTKNESGEKYVTLEGIQWDDYEGDISNEDETDSVSNQEKTAKEIEIPVGIDASYVKDTLTIQNYGNSMNSYSKLSECGAKYIRLIRK